eukprot:3474999-Pleurochrysis_carterae.AAC.2
MRDAIRIRRAKRALLRCCQCDDALEGAHTRTTLYSPFAINRNSRRFRHCFRVFNRVLLLQVNRALVSAT